MRGTTTGRRAAVRRGGVAAALGTATLVAAVLRARPYVIVTVRGRSMEPALRDGDRLLVRRGRRPALGEVVVAAYRGGWIVKRVGALPGDTVRLDRMPPPEGDRETRVPPGTVALFADNPDGSVDSRDVGPFPVGDLLGVVARRL